MVYPKSSQLCAWSFIGCAIFVSQISFSASQNMSCDLLTAARDGDIKQTLELLNRDVDPNLTDSFGNTPLREAALRNHKKIVQQLLNFGANPDQINIYGNPPLYDIAFWGSPESLECLLKSIDSSPIDHEDNDFLPIYTVVQTEQEKMVEILFKAGAQINDWFDRLSWAEQTIINKYRHIIGKRKNALKDLLDEYAGGYFLNVLRDLVEQFEGTYSKIRPQQHTRPKKRQHIQ